MNAREQRPAASTPDAQRWHGLYDAYRAAVVTVFVGLGALGFATAHDAGNGLPAGAVVQLGTVVQGHQPGNFNDTATLDTTEVAPGR
jgi:hypothetical protein